jgi:hypothetical protein
VNANDPGEDERPWERPGAVRRDSEPDRGEALTELGYVGLLLGAFSLLGGFTAPLALGLGVIVWLRATHDLRAIRAGRGHPAAETALRDARRKGIAAVFFALVCGLIGGLLLLYQFW